MPPLPVRVLFGLLSQKALKPYFFLPAEGFGFSEVVRSRVRISSRKTLSTPFSLSFLIVDQRGLVFVEW